MKKSLIYYLAQIKEAYPEMTDIKNAEYERISAEINAQIQAGVPITAHKQLYSKTYRFLKSLAKYYAETGMDYRSFNDNLSALQLELMERLNYKVAQKEWYLNFNCYVSVFFSYCNKFIKHFKKDAVVQKNLTEKLIENLINDKIINQIYEKELRNVEINEIKEIFKESINSLPDDDPDMKSLTLARIEALCDYFGLGGRPEQNMHEIARAKGISKEAVRQRIHAGLQILRNPLIGTKIYELYRESD